MSVIGGELLTQISSCVMTTLPLRLARCSALRPSPSPQVSLTCCRPPCASSSTTSRRSSSAVALSSCWPSDRSAPGSDATNRRCSYFARIQRSLSSLTDETGRLLELWQEAARQNKTVWPRDATSGFYCVDQQDDDQQVLIDYCD